MSAITKASPAAIAAAPRRWFHTVQWVRAPARAHLADGSAQDRIAQMPTTTLSTAVPNRASISGGVTAVRLTDCIALIPWAGGSRRRAARTNPEKAKNTPPTRPAPAAAATVIPCIVPLIVMLTMESAAPWSLRIEDEAPLTVVAVVRGHAWPDAHAPGWYRGYSDPVVGEALRQIDHAPQQPWTVQSLAAAAGVSRATLARRFSELVGESPMTFLTGRRIALAADLLREPQATLESVARQVGYASPYALSTAFKRLRGVSPQQYRAGARSPA
jgi:AraC-like DNA-binding protein